MRTAELYGDFFLIFNKPNKANVTQETEWTAPEWYSKYSYFAEINELHGLHIPQMLDYIQS